MDGVAQTLGQDGLARVGGQAEQEEAGLSGGEAVEGLEERGSVNTLRPMSRASDAVAGDLTLSTLMIWNFWLMSAGLEGSLDLPETKRRKSTRSSLVNSSRLCQNQPMSLWLSVMSRYRTSFFSVSTETSGRPQTSCSSCCAVSSERRGTGMMADMPSLTAATWTTHERVSAGTLKSRQRKEQRAAGGSRSIKGGHLPTCDRSKPIQTWESISCSRYSSALSTYSVRLEKDKAMF